jgi:hypothetical protein
MQITFALLDNRHKGYPEFSHRALISGPNKFSDFVKIRRWCWETWGPSCERDFTQYECESDEIKWAWHVDSFSNDKCYIYLVNTELTHFTLKWT